MAADSGKQEFLSGLPAARAARSLCLCRISGYQVTENGEADNMVKADLITGFLGSGKTTFIKKYAAYLMRRGYSVGILENDFGAVNVDMMLLQELRGDKCELEMVSACCGNDPDAHRRRFRTKLISMGMSGYDRVIIEPSGIFDVDEFFDILHDEPLDRWYEVGNVIAIADAKLEERLSKEADYILATEIADAGRVVLSRSQEASAQEIMNTQEHLNRALAGVRCSRSLDAGRDIFCRDWEKLTDEDYETLLNSGYRQESYVKQDLDEHGGFDSYYFMNVRMGEEDLRDAAKHIFRDSACGGVLRMKGFLRTEDGSWRELNATPGEIRMSPIPEGQEVLIVIGEHLCREAIAAYLPGAVFA